MLRGLSSGIWRSWSVGAVKGGVVARRFTSSKPKRYESQPPAPETCCGSGCEKCVWLEYLKDLQAVYTDHEMSADEQKEYEQKRQNALDQLDPALRAFIEFELQLKQKK